jgi:conjugative transposon TraM protein
MDTNNGQMEESKPKLTNGQKQKMKKYAVFTLMGIICAGCIWFIFAPPAGGKAKQEQTAGFNSDIPMPKEAGLINDKRDAYEQEQMKGKQAEKMRSLEAFSSMLGSETTETDGLALVADDEPAPKNNGTVSLSRTQSPVQNSAYAYRDMNRTLGSFYETPKTDPEKERLKEELEELKMRMDENGTRKNPVDEQMELMEKSFQMAAKYMPGTAGTSGTYAAGSAEPAEPKANAKAPGKPAVVLAGQVQPQVVSLLQPGMSGAEFIETYSQPRNMEFITAAGQTDIGMKNTISACIHANQTVMDGQSVRLRLLEPVHASGMYIPRNTLVSGTAKIQGERLDITVNSLENDGTILPAGLTVYGLDGQRGIFIPNLQELNAAKEIAANMGTSAGTSINLSNDAEKQFIADMGRNLIQGVSQFTAKKLREVKVSLKGGYKVYLLPENEPGNNQQLANQ